MTYRIHLFNFYSVDTTDAPTENPVTTTMAEITTVFMDSESTTDVSRRNTPTEKPWWHYIFSKIPGYQILTVGPHWTHIHPMVR